MVELTDEELSGTFEIYGQDAQRMAEEIRAARKFRAALGFEAWPTETELAVPRFWHRLARYSDVRHVELLEKAST